MRHATTEPSSGTEAIPIVCADHSVHWIPADQFIGYLSSYLCGMTLCAIVGVAILVWSVLLS